MVVTSRSEQELDNTIAQLRHWQRVAKRVVAGIDDPDAGKRLYTEAVHLSGAIDMVINNVSNVLHRPFIPLPEFTLEEAGFDEGALDEGRVLDGPDLRAGRRRHAVASLTAEG